MKNNLIEKQDKIRQNCKISQRTGLFSSTENLKFPHCFAGLLVDPYPPGVVYWKTFLIIGHFKVTQYFVEIVR